MVAPSKPKTLSITLTVFVEVTINDLFVIVSRAIRFITYEISLRTRTFP